MEKRGDPIALSAIVFEFERGRREPVAMAGCCEERGQGSTKPPVSRLFSSQELQATDRNGLEGPISASPAIVKNEIPRFHLIASNIQLSQSSRHSLTVSRIRLPARD